MSPSMKRNARFCRSLRPSLSRRRFSGLPVAKLSRPTTSWSSLRSCSARCEPMKPAAPVTSHARGFALMRASSSAYFVSMGSPCGIEFNQDSLVALDHRALRKRGFDGGAGALAQAAREAAVGEAREALDQGRRVAGREEKAVLAVLHQLRGAADVRMHHGLAERHGLERRERQRLGAAAQD